MRYKLFIPGPCEVEEEVLAAMARPTPRHYGDEWMKIYNETLDLLKRIFQTRNDLFMVPAAGSGAIDMAFGSAFSPGDTVVVGTNGFFGERMVSIAESWGLKVVKLEAPWGLPLDPEDLRRLLREHPEARGVALVHHETSTTVMNPLKELAEVAREKGLLLIVDAISSLGGVPLPVDEWGIDLCITVANKCLECPPGLAFISISPKAWEFVEKNSSPHGWYLNLKVWKDYSIKWAKWHPYPTTLPTNNILALKESLKHILEKEGLETHFERYRKAARAVRMGLKALGFEMLVEEAFASPIATAVKMRDGLSAKDLMDYLADEFGILVSGGLGPFEGKIFRVGHMGKASTRPFLMEFLFAVEEFLRSRGIPVRPGESMVGLV
ncbi:MAG: alanine--glyoxylate aminotransferase family protein [Anaerolineae bacterium]|nr:alanine--glyoxylate aminotransferase family protein [Anaerolineae bacterium]